MTLDKKKKFPLMDFHFRESSSARVKLLYKNYLPRISQLIISMNGTPEDAKDVFQEALIVIYQKSKDTDFKIHTNLYAYLKQVCKFIWLRKLRKDNFDVLDIKEAEALIPPVYEEDILEKKERQQIISDNLNKLSPDNLTVMDLFFQGKSMKEISIQMGYTESFARLKKYRAKKQLISKLEKDQRFIELKQMR